MSDSMIYTVRGPIPSETLGRTLMHEHLLVDFVGASRIGPGRYHPDEAFKVLLPYLKALRNQGFDAFVECTPMYLGRDPALFRRLSAASGLHILTNTGMYAAGERAGEPEPYVPEYAFALSASELAGTWLKEWYEGIAGTGIRPGFIKTGVTPGGSLRPISEKIIRAAAHTVRRTGLAMACHTVEGTSAMRILEIFSGEEVPADRFIYVHAQGEKDRSYHRKVAAAGGWVELDGIGPQSADLHADAVIDLLEQGYGHRILLSQDAGWYRPGEPGGGEIRGFTYLWDEFVPMLRKRGVSDQTIDEILVHNPREALSV